MTTTPEDARTRTRSARSEGEERAAQLRAQADLARSREQKPDVPKQPAAGRRLPGMDERVNQARADDVLADVRDPGWWNRATVDDLARAQSVARSAGAASGSGAAIQMRMNDVARTRYGTDLRGAIQYEGRNPGQPPPDVHGPSMTRTA